MYYTSLIHVFILPQEVPLGEEGQSLGVQVDPVNHTLIVNDEMELTGVPGLVDEPPGDFGESQGQNNKVDYNFLRSLVSSDKKANWYGAFLQTNIFSNKILFVLLNTLLLYKVILTLIFLMNFLWQRVTHRKTREVVSCEI